MPASIVKRYWKRLGMFSLVLMSALVVTSCAKDLTKPGEQKLSFVAHTTSGAAVVLRVDASFEDYGVKSLQVLDNAGRSVKYAGIVSPTCAQVNHGNPVVARLDITVPLRQIYDDKPIEIESPLRVRIDGKQSECGGMGTADGAVWDDVYAYTNEVPLPAYVPEHLPEPPVVVVFAHATPVGSLGTLIDARLSTGGGTLSYEWSPAACAGTTYPLGLGHDDEAAPTGTARYSGTEPTTCTVVVKDANGSSASKTLEMPAIDRGLQNSGGLSFAGASVAVKVIGALSPSRACLDLDNTGLFSVEVEMEWDPTLGAYAGSRPLAQIGAGRHRVSATLWREDANDDCENTTATGAAQVISNLYTVDAAGAVREARRGARVSAFVAPSSLRFASSKTIGEGAYDAKAGTIRGATTSGSFTWRTPATAKGVKRPAGATSLAKGAYVMRSIDMLQGPLVGKASILLGTGTVLLRGTDGTMACGTLAGGFDSSTLTLAGGTRAARTLAGNVTGKQVTYVFPTPTATAAAKRSGGVSGLLATALGWITGDQPAARAAKPAKKPKPVKVRPVRSSGTASLQTAAKATGLPASCKALVRYLPQ